MLISKTDMYALLSCFNLLFCIIDYFVNTEYVNSHYPVDIPCNLFTKCLFQNCPVCVDCIAFSGCSVLSTILSTIGCSVNLLSCLHWLRVTLTIQATFPVICLLNACIKTALLALTVLLCLVVLYSRLSCLHRLRVTFQSSWHSL